MARDATVGGTLALFPPSNLYLQHLNLLHIDMQTFDSATTGEPQKPLYVIISENLDLETVTSSVDLPLVSATTGGPRKPSDVVIGEDLGLEIVSNSVRCRQLQLVENKADVVQSNTLRGNFSSPICRLPTEILSEIFLYCLPEDEHWVYASRLAPLLLTRICRQWREVAVGLPRLWCRLQLELCPNPWQDRAFGYDSWLKRSAACPLSLRLTCRTDWSKLCSLLQPYIQQISSLSLDFVSCDSPFVMEDFHALKELTIHQDVRDHPARAVKRSLSKLPVNLRRINMQHLWFDCNQLGCLTASAWACLTHLEIGIDGLNAFTRILRLCPDLSSLKMIGIFYTIETPELVTHTNLQSLSMSWSVLSNTDEDIGLFEVITLPNLRVLEARDTGRWPHASCMEFLMRSERPLERLIFDRGVWTTERERAEYATLVPSFELIADPASDFNVDEE
ncbi:hypothetical protein F4604DRAFT_1917876 [Suillus subluteus]|nr:hypothetical protein F4604DRAFT_1917876 [Suillus subluteus]